MGSASLGHESESTEGGSALLYRLIKINLVCPMLKVERRQWETIKHLLLSRYRTECGGEQAAVTSLWLWFMTCGTGNKTERSSDVCRGAKQTDYETSIWTCPGNEHSRVRMDNPRVRCMRDQIQLIQLHVSTGFQQPSHVSWAFQAHFILCENDKLDKRQRRDWCDSEQNVITDPH